MGGLGSGRRFGHTPAEQVEWCLTLDATILAGQSVAPGLRGYADLGAEACVWDIPVWWIVRNVGDGDVLTLWRMDGPNDPWVHIDLTTLMIVSGGTRTYFRCPGLPGGRGCDARVAKLYWPLRARGGFGCRRCHRLVYRSSQERPRTIEDLIRRVYRD